MSSFADDALREHLRERVEEHDTRAERADGADEPAKAARHLREAADGYEELAELEDRPGLADTYRDQAAERRRLAERLTSTDGVRARSGGGTTGVQDLGGTDGAPDPAGDPGAGGDGPGVDDRGSAPDLEFETPSIDFSDVGGYSGVKQELLDKVVDPIRRSDLYDTYDIEGVNGVLFKGPPGTGKTHTARALAGETGWAFLELSPADVVSSLVGEGAKNLSRVFELARDHQPCLVFFDEIDSIAPDRTGTTQGTQSEQMMLTQLLTEMNELAGTEVVVVGATNAPEAIDRALVRNSQRFGEVIEFPLPGPPARRAILKVHLRDRPVLPDRLDYDRIVDLTEGFSAGDLKQAVADAALRALKEARERDELVRITQEHLESAVATRRERKASAEDGGYL